MINRIVGLCFSPRGGTAAITEQIMKVLGDELSGHFGSDMSFEMFDLLRQPERLPDFDENTLAVIAMPSRIGKLPIPGISVLKELEGSGALAVTTVSYGTRSYGNALYELYRYSEQSGFKVIGAGAFVAKHAGIRTTCIVRPDENDLNHIEEFARAAGSKVNRLSGSEVMNLKIKPAPIPVCGKIPVHRISRVSPTAAAIAERSLERICPFKSNTEWFL